jgi:two-component system, OmpR family, sensor kinase
VRPHGHWKHWHRPRTRIGAYMRARLRRRIFVWFGLTILLAFVAVLGTMHFVGNANSWKREVERARTLTVHSFERVWDQPAEREALARMVAHDLDADVTVRDGANVLVVGQACDKPTLTAAVRSGDVAVCLKRPKSGPRIIIPLLIAGLVIWAIAGRIARRLSRPYDQLASLAGELGGGKLNARVPMSRWQDEDAAIVGKVLNDMAARVEKQLADQRELLAAVSHEIRTPLSRVRILTELGRDGGDVQKIFDDIDREVIEIDALVSELLASARLDFAAAKPIELDAVDAGKRALERSSEEENKLDAEPSQVRADPTLLARALANLIDNAKRHGQGLDKLRIQSEGDRVRFEALDRGPGIPPGDEEKIFESFYRGERTRDDKPSLGLGLALVRRIAEAHGGKVYARNREGGGAIVGLDLPRA